MQEFIVPLAAAGTAAGLIVAGINIAKGRKKYIERDEHTKMLERVHSRIDMCEEDVNALKKTTNSLEHKVDVLSVSVGELKSDVKDVWSEIKTVGEKQSDCNRFVQDVDKSVYGLQVLLKQYMNTKER